MFKFKLYLEFFKIGLFSIGGGLATLPFLFDLASRTNFITNHELVNMIAISQCTPGPVGVNVATFVGINNGGILNGILVTLSLALPSFIVIYIIANYIDKKYTTNRLQLIFKWLRPCALGFMFVALISVIQASVIDIKTLLFVVVMFILEYKFPKHPLKYLLLSGIVGILIL